MNTERIYLPEALNQNYAEELHVLLCDLCETCGELLIDASRVEQVSTAVMQVLLSAIQTFDKFNKKIEIVDASQEFIKISSILGISNLGVKQEKSIG